MTGEEKSGEDDGFMQQSESNKPQNVKAIQAIIITQLTNNYLLA